MADAQPTGFGVVGKEGLCPVCRRSVPLPAGPPVLGAPRRGEPGHVDCKNTFTLQNPGVCFVKRCREFGAEHGGGAAE
jgi:hypothetical protein